MEDNNLRDYFSLQVDDLRNRIISHHDNLEINAAWLFVATLGCWSVSQSHIRILAALIILFLFIKLVFAKKQAETVDKVIKNLKSEIERSSIQEDFKKARYFDLDQISKDLLSYKVIPRRAPQFIICYVFWGISITYFTVNL